MVKRTHPPYDYWLGIVVKIERVSSKAVKFPACKNQTYDTIWVQWTNSNLYQAGAESYWAEDLKVISKGGLRNDEGSKKQIPTQR